MKRAASIVALLLSVGLLTGCWDRVEINDIAFVSGSAVDLEEGKYRATVQIPLPSQMGGAGSQGGGGGTTGAKSWYIESEVGDTIRLANSIQQTRLSRRLYFAHRRVVLFGEAMNRAGISTALDLFARIPQNRLTSYLVAAKGKAHEVLTTDVPIEQTPSEMIRELTAAIMKNPPTILTAGAMLVTDGVDLVLPAVQKKTLDVNNGDAKETLELSSLALFKGDQLAGFVEGEETSSLLWMMNEASNPQLSVEPPGGGKIALQFAIADSKIKPKVQEDQIELQIEVRGRGTIVENDSRFDPLAYDNLSELERLAEQKVEDQVDKLISKLQDMGCDPLGVGLLLSREQPHVWKGLSERWAQVYPRMKVVVVPIIHIEHLGPLNDPFSVKEVGQNDG